jgi:hypothetical protein
LECNPGNWASKWANREYVVSIWEIHSDIVLKFLTQQPPAKAGGLKIGGLNRRLKENTSESRWFAPRAERPSGGLKPPYGNQKGQNFFYPIKQAIRPIMTGNPSLYHPKKPYAAIT